MRRERLSPHHEEANNGAGFRSTVQSTELGFSAAHTLGHPHDDQMTDEEGYESSSSHCRRHVCRVVAVVICPDSVVFDSSLNINRLCASVGQLMKGSPLSVYSHKHHVFKCD